MPKKTPERASESGKNSCRLNGHSQLKTYNAGHLKITVMRGRPLIKGDAVFLPEEHIINF